MNHDAPCCSDCNDTGQVADPRSADEDGVADYLPCPNCRRAEAEQHQLDRTFGRWPKVPYLNDEDIPW